MTQTGTETYTAYQMNQYDVPGTPTAVSSRVTVTQNCTDLDTDLAMKWVLLAANKAVQSESFLTQKNKNKFFALLNAVEMQVPAFHIAIFYPLHPFTVRLLDMTDR